MPVNESVGSHSQHVPVNKTCLSKTNNETIRCVNSLEKDRQRVTLAFAKLELVHKQHNKYVRRLSRVINIEVKC